MTQGNDTKPKKRKENDMDANSLLFKVKNAKAFSFAEKGATVEGHVDTLSSRQRHEYDPKADNKQGLPMWWLPSGKSAKPAPMDEMSAKRLDLRPVEDAIVTLKTSLKDNDEDDGRRSVFINSIKLREALVQAVKDAKGSEIEIGAWIRITYTEDGPVAKGAPRGPKLYTVEYKTPANAPAQADNPGEAADDDNPFA